MNNLIRWVRKTLLMVRGAVLVDREEQQVGKVKGEEEFFDALEIKVTSRIRR